MLIFYPTKCGGLLALGKQLEQSFDFTNLKTLFKQQVVSLFLPRFVIDYTVENIDYALKNVYPYNMLTNNYMIKMQHYTHFHRLD